MRTTTPANTLDGWLSRVFFGAALVGPCLLVQDLLQGHGVGWLAVDLAIGIPGLVLGYLFRRRDRTARGTE